MLNQFSRTQLLLGEEGMKKLAGAEWQYLESAVLADMCVRRW